MKPLKLADYRDYQQHLDKLYRNELGEGARFSMISSLTPAMLTEGEAIGFVDRYELIQEFWRISQELFKRSLTESSLSDVRDLILNEVNPQFSLTYHQDLYKGEVGLPLFFRTDESIPGKISEIQNPGSGWGNLNSLQTSLNYVRKYTDVPTRCFNKQSVAEVVSTIIEKLTQHNPLVFHQVDESSNMIDTNYFISMTRKYGLKYLGHDHEAIFKNVNFLRTHSFMEQVTASCFMEFLQRYHKHELIFDTFPSILFFQKIPLIFPFWERTRQLYSDRIRELFPFTSLVEDKCTLESGERLTPQQFSQLQPHDRNYYLKYAGADGSINWGSKAVYHLGKCSSKQCIDLLGMATEGSRKNKYWIMQKSYHRMVKALYPSEGALIDGKSYAKWSGFYGPTGFMGGFVMSGKFHKVHGQKETVCRLLL